MSPERYRNLRRQIGTQKEVSFLLGLQQSVISKRERGKAPISREISLAIHQLFQQTKRERSPLPLLAFPPGKRSTEKASERRQDAKAVQGGVAKTVQDRNARLAKRRGRPLVIPNLQDALAN